MSRIGKQPVTIPSNVTATITGQEVKVKGPKGELSFTVPDQIKVQKAEAGIEVTLAEETKLARAMWGMSRTMVANLVSGVTDLKLQLVQFSRRVCETIKLLTLAQEKPRGPARPGVPEPRVSE